MVSRAVFEVLADALQDVTLAVLVDEQGAGMNQRERR
jgi:hypothetical protein